MWAKSVYLVVREISTVTPSVVRLSAAALFSNCGNAVPGKISFVSANDIPRIGCYRRRCNFRVVSRKTGANIALVAYSGI